MTVDDHNGEQPRGADVAASAFAPPHKSVWLRRLVLAALSTFVACGIGGYWLHDTAQTAKTERRDAFLTQFRESFRSGIVVLRGEPQLMSIERWSIRPAFFAPPAVSEYRITAPILVDDVEKWGVWNYSCNSGHGDGIFEFGYVETLSPNQFPLPPAPAKRYIPWAEEMVDGIPVTACPAAQVVSVTSPAPFNQPITLVARCPPGTTCEPVVFPSDAVMASLAEQSPDENGVMQWTFSLSPKYRPPSQIRVILKCTEFRGTERLENSATEVTLELTDAQ